MKVLCVGQTTYDISCVVKEYPKENAKHIINEKYENGGGSAANEASLLAKWGIETYLVSSVGADSYGEKIKKELEMFGVKLPFFETAFDKTTSTSFIITNRSNGSRTMFHIGSNDTLPHVKKEEDVKVDANLIMLDGYEYHASIHLLEKNPNAISILSAVDLTTEVLDLCGLCKYIIISKDFAERLTAIKMDFKNTLTLVSIYEKLVERFNKSNIIVTLEDMGAMYLLNNEIKVMPGIKVDVVDTTGAGDVFHSAFAYGILQNFDLEKAIGYANVAAGLSCSQMGNKMSIPNINNVVAYYNSKMGVVNVIPQSAVNLNQ